MGENVQISTVDGFYTAYIAHPPSGHGPGLLVLPEIYNSNEHIRGVAENFSAEGFITLAPDVFWRIQPDCYLPYTESGQARARELNQGLDVDHTHNRPPKRRTVTSDNVDGNWADRLSGILLGRKTFLPMCHPVRSRCSSKLLWSQNRELS